MLKVKEQCGGGHVWRIDAKVFPEAGDVGEGVHVSCARDAGPVLLVIPTALPTGQGEPPLVAGAVSAEESIPESTVLQPPCPGRPGCPAEPGGPAPWLCPTGHVLYSS